MVVRVLIRLGRRGRTAVSGGGRPAHWLWGRGLAGGRRAARPHPGWHARRAVATFAGAGPAAQMHGLAMVRPDAVGASSGPRVGLVDTAPRRRGHEMHLSARPRAPSATVARPARSSSGYRTEPMACNDGNGRCTGGRGRLLVRRGGGHGCAVGWPPDARTPSRARGLREQPASPVGKTASQPADGLGYSFAAAHPDQTRGHDA